MTAAEMQKAIGRTGYVHISGDAYARARVVDVKTSYGSVRYKIEAEAGAGSAWIDAARFRTHTPNRDRF